MAPFVALAVTAFLITTAAVRFARRPNSDLTMSAPSSDSATLARMGMSNGRQLVAFVMVSSECAVCQSKPVRDVLERLRSELKGTYGRTYSMTSVVAVAIDNIAPGLKYLESIGLDAFDQVQVGGGWLNEGAVRHVWRDAAIEGLVPQIILMSREMSAQLEPDVDLRFSSDSVLRVVRGGDELALWIASGLPLHYKTVVTATQAPSLP